MMESGGGGPKKCVSTTANNDLAATDQPEPPTLPCPAVLAHWRQDRDTLGAGLMTPHDQAALETLRATIKQAILALHQTMQVGATDADRADRMELQDLAAAWLQQIEHFDRARLF